MRRPITGDDVIVQVESARHDVWIPEGLALPKLPYTPEGLTLAFDGTSGLSLQGLRNEDKLLRFGPFTADVDAGWASVRPITYDPGDDAPTQMVGSSLVETKVPIPVEPGMRVAMSGTTKVRRSGLTFKSSSNTTDFNDPVGVQAVIYARSFATNAYGTESRIVSELKRVRTELQARDSTAMTELTFTFGDPDALEWVTIPEGIDRIMFAIELVDLYTYGPSLHRPAAIPYKITDTSNRYLFRSPVVGSTTDDPIQLHIQDSSNVNPTYEHPLSSTGWAFRNRARFENITPGATLTAMGEPDGPAVTLSVYAWDETRGALLTTVDVPAGGKEVVALDHVGSIDIDATGTFYIESVLAQTLDADEVEQTHTTRYEYTPVTDEVSSIVTTLREADLSLALIRFVSDTIDTVIPAGRRARISAVPATGRVTMFAGTVRTRRKVNRPGRPAQLEIGVHDPHARLSAEYPAMFDQLYEYGPAAHRLGDQVVIDGVDYTGPPGPLPSWSTLSPSYLAERGTLFDALLATRNSRKAYLFTDRRGRVVFTSTLPDTVALTASDMPGDGDVSYSRELEVTTDSESILNVVTVDEHLIDRAAYVDRRWFGTGRAPQFPEYPEGMTQSISFRRESSVEMYGPSAQRFPVVLGSGNLTQVEAGDLGPTFNTWAQDILDRYATERAEYSAFTIPIESADQIAAVAALQPFDAIVLRHAGTTQIVRPRQVRHRIEPSGHTFGWVCEISMSPRKLQAFWLPPDPEIEVPPIDGGFYNDHGAGRYDGGTPDSPGIGVIDGGDLAPPPPPEWGLVEDFEGPPLAELQAPWVAGQDDPTKVIGRADGAATPTDVGQGRYYHSTALAADHKVEITLGFLAAGARAGVLVGGQPGLGQAAIIVYVSGDNEWAVTHYRPGDLFPRIPWASGTYFHDNGDVLRVAFSDGALTAHVNEDLLHTRTDFDGQTFGPHAGIYASGGARIERWRAGEL